MWTTVTRIDNGSTEYNCITHYDMQVNVAHNVTVTATDTTIISVTDKNK